MDSFRPQKSPSSDRFLGLLSSSPPSPSSPSFELHEDDIFSTDTNPNPNPSSPNPNFANPNPNPSSPNPNFANPNPSSTPRSRSSPLSPFHRGGGDRNFGILAALPEEPSASGGFLRRKPSVSTSTSPSSSARMIPIAPKPSAGDQFPRIQQHSAPVNVPMAIPRGAAGRRQPTVEETVEDEEDEEEMMLPPHEIVDRAQGKGEPMTTFSMLEGAGRTLKGRDLRRVRNAVWRRTGFLD